MSYMNEVSEADSEDNAKYLTAIYIMEHSC